MLYRKFGCTGWRMSAIGIGCRSVAKQWGKISEGMSEEIIKAAYKSGINLFDATEVCGDKEGINEVRLGRALKGIRDKVFIAAKVNLTEESNDGINIQNDGFIRGNFERSASRLNTDYIDILLYDSGNGTITESHVAELKDLKSKGYIREYGISTSSIAELSRFYEMSEGGCSVVQLEYSLLNRDAENNLLPYCKEKNLAVMAKGVLYKGVLSGKFNKNSVFSDPVRKAWNIDGQERAGFEQQLDNINKIRGVLEDASDMSTTALRYVISHEAEPVAIPGVTCLEQVLKNARAGLRLLSKEELKLLRNTV